jgi:hypothetical protein
VPRSGGEEVRHVEAGRATDDRADVRIAEQALEELGLGLVPDVRDHDQVDVRGDEPRAPTT